MRETLDDSDALVVREEVTLTLTDRVSDCESDGVAVTLCDSVTEEVGVRDGDVVLVASRDKDCEGDIDIDKVAEIDRLVVIVVETVTDDDFDSSREAVGVIVASLVSESEGV